MEAKEGSSPSTTAFPGTTTLSDGPVSDSSSKWDTTSDTVRAESGSKEMGGISNSSSPRLGVWNVWIDARYNTNLSHHLWKINNFTLDPRNTRYSSLSFSICDSNSV